jgi:hypothetical protein
MYEKDLKKLYVVFTKGFGIPINNEGKFTKQDADKVVLDVPVHSLSLYFLQDNGVHYVACAAAYLGLLNYRDIISVIEAEFNVKVSSFLSSLNNGDDDFSYRYKGQDYLVAKTIRP